MKFLIFLIGLIITFPLWAPLLILLNMSAHHEPDHSADWILQGMNSQAYIDHIHQMCIDQHKCVK